MSTRFMYKALATAALGIALSLSLAATTSASSAWSTEGAIQLDAPAAPSNCKTGQFRIRDRRKGYDYISYYMSWRDNSTNEDGFTLELWWRNQSGVWVLAETRNLAADSTRSGLGGRLGPDYRFRVKAFNAAGDSAWSNWGQ